MARRRMVYEGKAKILYEGPEPGTLVQYFKDDATRPARLCYAPGGLPLGGLVEVEAIAIAPSP